MKALMLPISKKSIVLLIIIVLNIIQAIGKILPSQDASVEIVSIEKVPIIKCMLNGHETYFVLDSGSELTLVHAIAAEKLGFTFKSRATRSIVGASGGNQPLHEAQSVELTIAQQTLKTRFYATDLSVVVQFLSDSTGLSISGILGMDLMRRYGFEIDYLSQQLVWHPID